MKAIIAVFPLMFISFTALAETRPATADDIKKLSSKLVAGTYKGSNTRGNECTVMVVDNGGDGTGYSVAVTPTTYSTANLEIVDVSVTVGTPMDSKADMTAVSISGVNFQSFLSIAGDTSGPKFVTITSKVAGDRATANCQIK